MQKLWDYNSGRAKELGNNSLWGRHFEQFHYTLHQSFCPNLFDSLVKDPQISISQLLSKQALLREFLSHFVTAQMLVLYSLC